MSGFLTNNLPSLGLFTGLETLPADANPSSAGATPLQEKIALTKLAILMTHLGNALSKTMVAGTIYYARFDIGAITDPTPLGSNISLQSFLATGMMIPVGGTGGTDTWHCGVWNSSGTLVARSATAGSTAGTALTTQQIAFAGSTGAATGVDAPVLLTSGTYYLGLQSSGTTATFRSINSAIWPLATGSQSGSAGTLPAISSLATIYTANLGPQLALY